MTRSMSFYTALLLTAVFVSGGPLAQAQPKQLKVSFGSLEAASAETARTQATAWLKEIGKTDAGTQQKLEAIWKQNERPVLDRLLDSFVLGQPTIAGMLKEARDIGAPAPTSVPAVLEDSKQSAFFRNNLAYGYARLLVQRRVYDEALTILKTLKPEQVIEPAGYLFNRAVAEHALLQKVDANKTIYRLLEDAVGTPERYKMVGTLMLLDMQTWKEKDLAEVARKMKRIEDRLEIARGGPQTQRLQKEVVMRLDELIKEMENKAKPPKGGEGEPKPNGEGCPDGGQPKPGSGQKPGGGADPSSPMPDSNIATNGGRGDVDPAKLRKLQSEWGRMTERQRAAALQDLTRGMAASHREAIENYFRNIALGKRP